MTATATIEVDLSAGIGQVHPYVFGHFLEHFPGQVYGGIYDEDSPHSDERGFRTDTLQALREAGTPLIRWPGGCYTSGYDWRWGAGPQEERQTRESPCWRFQDTHRFGTTEFAELCRDLGAEPLICAGVGRKERSPTPEMLAAWVRYCNSPTGPEAELRARAGFSQPLEVRLWGLGNEVFAEGYPESPGDYASDVVKYARAMLREDPRLRFVIVGAERHWLEGGWNDGVLTADALQFADWISWHDYFHTGMSGPERPYEEAVDHLLEVESTIEKLARMNREASRRAGRKRPIEIAVDEWNELGWVLKPEKRGENDRSDTYRLANGLYTAGFLNVLIRHAADVTMANYSPTVNTRGFVFVSDQGILRRPSWYVYRMYRSCARGTAVRSEVRSPTLPDSRASVLDAAAVVSPEGELELFVVNRAAGKDVACSIRTAGHIMTSVSATVLGADSMASFNDFEDPQRVATRHAKFNVRGSSFVHTFPAGSATKLVLLPA